MHWPLLIIWLDIPAPTAVPNNDSVVLHCGFSSLAVMSHNARSTAQIVGCTFEKRRSFAIKK